MSVLYGSSGEFCKKLFSEKRGILRKEEVHGDFFENLHILKINLFSQDEIRKIQKIHAIRCLLNISTQNCK